MTAHRGLASSGGDNRGQRQREPVKDRLKCLASLVREDLARDPVDPTLLGVKAQGNSALIAYYGAEPHEMDHFVRQDIDQEVIEGITEILARGRGENAGVIELNAIKIEDPIAFEVELRESLNPRQDAFGEGFPLGVLPREEIVAHLLPSMRRDTIIPGGVLLGFIQGA